MRKYFNLIALLLLVFSISCAKETNHKDCALLPNGGPCKAYIPKFYFDQAENRCKTFIYGGCDGVVPFETLEDCNKNCPCQGN